MKRMLTALALCLAAPGAWAGPGDIVTLQAAREVPATMDALEAAVTGAGATVFARVDHAAGAAGVDMQLAPAQLLIFGNPMLGTPAMQDEALAGVFLPLRVLVYEDAQGRVWLAYEDPGAMLGALPGIAEEAGYIAQMRAALAKLTGAAAGG